MLKKFYSNEFDNEIVITDKKKEYNYRALKSLIAGAIKAIQNKKQNIVISESDNFNFIIKFFASIFANKNIYLLSDIKKLSSLEIDFDLFDEKEFEPDNNFSFPEIEVQNIIINFFTSGSSAKSKVIKKSLYNLIKEGEDLGLEFEIKDKIVISTTTMCHLFGMTFHLMFSLINNLRIYTPSIFYPDNLDIDNAILVSTPTFLNTVEKHKIQFKNAPKYIITAGSKLNENVFKYLEEQTKVIEIYGSTETGVIAHKEHYRSQLKIFKNVNIKINEENIEIQSPYAFEDKVTINDKAEIKNGYLILKNRTDRLVKIFDKRISLEELEGKLNENPLINESYIFKYEDKLASLCALSNEGQKYLIKSGIFELKKDLKNHLKSYSEIIPSRWKFIDIIPRGQTGKINKELINHIFDFTLSLPVILDRRENENKIEYNIFFYNACNFFSGHFPNFKILPGVVQLFIAKEFINAHFNLDIGQGQWKKIKFSNMITPDNIIKLNLEKKEKQVEYKFFDDKKIYSSGIFVIENVFKEMQCI